MYKLHPLGHYVAKKTEHQKSKHRDNKREKIMIFHWVLTKKSLTNHKINETKHHRTKSTNTKGF